MDGYGTEDVDKDVRYFLCLINGNRHGNIIYLLGSRLFFVVQPSSLHSRRDRL